MSGAKLEGPREWLDEKTWQRLRQALDDGVSQRKCSTRFDININQVSIVSKARTLDEARQLLWADVLRRRAKQTEQEDACA